MAGRINIRRIDARTPAKSAKVVRIPRTDNGRRHGSAKMGWGIQIGGAWVVFTRWDRDRISYTVDAPTEIAVQVAVPVVLE